jgi:hypothetical protein
MPSKIEMWLGLEWRVETFVVGSLQVVVSAYDVAIAVS